MVDKVQKENKVAIEKDNNVQKTKKKKQNNRFSGVIEKMEEETKKIEKTKSKSKTDTKENKTKHSISENKLKSTEYEKELDKIGEEIKKQNTIPKETMYKINSIVFKNIIIAIIILVYFILINMGFLSIKPEVFLTDLKVFSITLIIATICVFEQAYKRENSKLAITGIELLILAISTLVSLKVYNVYKYNFINIITSIALLFDIYYVGKAIVIYVKEKKKAKKITSDIHKIAKKK